MSHLLLHYMAFSCFQLLKKHFIQGRQEDAEEYLGFILNGLHEEMLTLKKLLSPHNES